MSTRRHTWLLSALLGLAAQAPLQASAIFPVTSEDAVVAELIDEDDARELYRSTLAKTGSVDELFAEIDARIAADPTVSDRWLAAELARQHGDLDRAIAMLDELCAEEGAPDRAFVRRAELFDARGRSQEALDAYREAVEAEREGLEPGLLRLRIALLETELGDGPSKSAAAASDPTQAVAINLTSLVAPGASGSVSIGSLTPAGESSGSESSAPKEDEPPSALAVYARESGDADLCRRAATVLAFLGRPAEAAELYVAVGEDTARFRQEVRLAEWALLGDDLDNAREHAWTAVREASLRRDRRYALGVLVEAHREAESLRELITLFTETENLDLQSQEVWIDLLRETGETEEALRLFRERTGGELTPSMRRELLEICRESGREDVLVEAYRELLETEPEILEWREGYARYELERGKREAASALWTDWLPDAPKDLLLPASQSLSALGLDREATEAAERTIEAYGPASLEAEAAYGFLFGLHLDRGRPEEAEAALARHDASVPPDAAGRLQLAENYERLGDTRRAVEVMEGVREARGLERSGEDLEMRLAWLYSEIGEEELALDRWRELWPRVQSVPRRRYVEDRMMTVAARLGVLADIAIELEEKLIAGTADARDSGLLVRLYTRVGDAVSAAEIIEDYMRQSGGDLREATAEKARVYLACKDYYNYEETVTELIGLDPENESDYLRQLAMSQLERGAFDEAREALERLKAIDGASDGAEFEAGVLALAGMRDDAENAYRKGIARHPERIDVYLLLANVLKDLGRTNQAIGMFQYLAATADADDLFTIAIDGLLNMEAGAAELKWARRITLERLAYRHDKPYLYQLLADLSEELNDVDGQLRALEGQLAIVGERRGPTLRELMDLAQAKRRTSERLAYGRRLLALGDLVPPQVYLDLGQAFLEGGEVTNASRTFGLATDLPDYGAFQRQVAEKFEQARYLEQALRVNERALLGSPTDVQLMMKVGELQERLGHQERALELYDRGVEVLLARRPLKDGKAEDEEEADPFSWWSGNRNVDDYDQHFVGVRRGLLATADDAHLYGVSWAREEALLRADLARLADETADKPLAAHPRVRDRAKFLRHLALASGDVDRVRALDLELLERYAGDGKLLETLVDERVRWGYIAAARTLLDEAPRSETAKAELAGAFGEGETRGSLSPEAARRGVLSRIARGEDESLRGHLQSVDLSTSNPADLEALPLLHGAAVYLNESELVLAFARQWMVLALSQATGWQSGGEVQSMLGRSRRVLDEDQRRSLIQQLVDRVVEKPEEADPILRLLPELEGWIDGPVLEAETALELINEKASSQFYGVMPLFALVALEDLPGCVRDLWPKVAESQRAWFLVEFVSGLERTVDPDFQDFLAGSFKEALDESDMADYIGYQLTSMTEGENANPNLVVRLVEVALATQPNNTQIRQAYARALQKAGREEEGLAYAIDVYEELVGSSSTDWEVRSALNELPEPYLPERVEDFISACDRALEAGSSAEQVLPRRFTLLDRTEDDGRIFAELAAAVEEHPKIADLRRRYAGQLRIRGQRNELVAMYQRALEEEPDSESVRNQLRGAWSALDNPVQALAALKGAEEEETEDAVDEEVSREEERQEAPTAEALVEAHTTGDAALARTLLHGLWRSLGGRRSPFGPGVIVFSSNGVIMNGSGGGSLQVGWPKVEEETDEPEEEVDPRLRQGGLVAWRARGEKALREGAERKLEAEAEDPDADNAWIALATEDYARVEMELARRTLQPDQFDSVTDFVRGLARASAAEDGVEVAVRGLLERTARGEAGKLDHAMLLTLFEEEPDAVGGEAREFLDEFCATLNPLDGAQLRRLARVALAVGDAERARRLYLWCATLVSSQSGGFVFGGASGQINPRDLLRELEDNLEGDDLTEVVAAVLTSSEPAFDPWGFGRGNYDDMVISTWSRILPPAEALEYGASAVAMATETEFGVQRNLARTVAVLLARAGEAERSVEALEYALCEFQPDEVELNSERAQWLAYTLRPGSLRSTDLHTLFLDESAWSEALPDPETARAAWMRAAAESLLAWDDEYRLASGTASTVFSLLAVELGRAGEPELATELANRVETSAGSSVNSLVWVIDVYRELEVGDRGDVLERELLADGRLTLSRWVAALRRLEAAEGREVALDLATELAQTARSEELLELLIEWSDGPEQDGWKTALAERLEAEAELEAIDEEARKKREAQRALRMR